jgi:hypothetical protein
VAGLGPWVKLGSIIKSGVRKMIEILIATLVIAVIIFAGLKILESEEYFY